MDILKQLNWIDLTIIIVLAWSVFRGMRAGLTAELFRFLGTIVSILISFHFNEAIAKIAYEYIPLQIWLLRLIAFTVTLISVYLISKIFIFLILKIVTIKFVPSVETAGGALAGIVRGCLVSGLLLTNFLFTPIEYTNTSILEKSLLSGIPLAMTRGVYALLIKFVPSQEPKELVFFYSKKTDPKKQPLVKTQ